MEMKIASHKKTRYIPCTRYSENSDGARKRGVFVATDMQILSPEISRGFTFFSTLYFYKNLFYKNFKNILRTYTQAESQFGTCEKYKSIKASHTAM